MTAHNLVKKGETSGHTDETHKALQVCGFALLIRGQHPFAKHKLGSKPDCLSEKMEAEVAS